MHEKARKDPGQNTANPVVNLTRSVGSVPPPPPPAPPAAPPKPEHRIRPTTIMSEPITLGAVATPDPTEIVARAIANAATPSLGLSQQQLRDLSSLFERYDDYSVERIFTTAHRNTPFQNRVRGRGMPPGYQHGDALAGLSAFGTTLLESYAQRGNGRGRGLPAPFYDTLMGSNNDPERASGRGRGLAAMRSQSTNATNVQSAAALSQEQARQARFRRKLVARRMQSESSLPTIALPAPTSPDSTTPEWRASPAIPPPPPPPPAPPAPPNLAAPKLNTTTTTSNARRTNITRETPSSTSRPPLLTAAGAAATAAAARANVDHGIIIDDNSYDFCDPNQPQPRKVFIEIVKSPLVLAQERAEKIERIRESASAFWSVNLEQKLNEREQQRRDRERERERE